MSDPLREIIRTQHPGIANELQGAINTLRKLQAIAGTPMERLAVDTDESGLKNTSISSSAGSGQDNDATFISDVPGLNLNAASIPELHAGENFGRYQVVRLLGRGAMGSVYLAYDGQLERYVALKQPILTDAMMMTRFYREARATAKLRSPYICPIYDVGSVGGLHFISMAYIDGRPLSEAIREKRLAEPGKIASVVQKIALGLSKAHEAGIMHRDLKPDNVMLEADDTPVIMDFGLARGVDDDIRLSRSGALIGSPAYMSPEQATGDPSLIGLSTDIYSLGVVLFELLTGKIPFTGSIVTVLRHIAETPPPAPHEVLPELKGMQGYAPLGAACMKMMAKRPQDRFATAADVAEAMARVADPNSGRPDSGRRWWQWFGRSRTAAAL